MASIILEQVAIEFPVYNLSARSFKNELLRISTGGKLGPDKKSKVIVKALDEISLRIEHGDRVGVIGQNGSGKSTLLRVMSQIYEPTHGVIHIDGKVSPLLDVSLGMDQESTGYENIMIRGLISGLTTKQIKDKIEDIANFSGLGDYLSMPVRTYSTGMRLRLAFATATSVHPDILILDEVVGAGDQNFMKKAQERMEELITRSSIMIVASHSQEIIRKFCNKVIHLEAGQLKFFGPVAEGLQFLN